jgi:hypothetical protein
MDSFRPQNSRGAFLNRQGSGLGITLSFLASILFIAEVKQ